MINKMTLCISKLQLKGSDSDILYQPTKFNLAFKVFKQQKENVYKCLGNSMIYSSISTSPWIEIQKKTRLTDKTQ